MFHLVYRVFRHFLERMWGSDGCEATETLQYFIKDILRLTDIEHNALSDTRTQLWKMDKSFALNEGEE